MGSPSLQPSLPSNARSTEERNPRVQSILDRANYVRATAVAGKPTIIVVEDNPADILLLKEALLCHDINSCLFVCADGDEAIRFIEDIDSSDLPCPDLIILDLNLPRKSGFDVLRRVRASERLGRCARGNPKLLGSCQRSRTRRSAWRLRLHSEAFNLEGVYVNRRKV